MPPPPVPPHQRGPRPSRRGAGGRHARGAPRSPQRPCDRAAAPPGFPRTRRRVRRPASSSNARRASARRSARAVMTSAIWRRTGFPVRTTLVPAGSRSAVASKVVATAAAQRAATRLTTPGTPFCSISTIGVLTRRAARIAGALAYPPMPTTTSAARTMGRTTREAANDIHRAFAVCMETRVCADATRTGTNGKPASGTRMASCPVADPTKRTSWPRTRSRSATASAGKT